MTNVSLLDKMLKFRNAQLKWALTLNHEKKWYYYAILLLFQILNYLPSKFCVPEHAPLQI